MPKEPSKKDNGVAAPGTATTSGASLPMPETDVSDWSGSSDSEAAPEAVGGKKSKKERKKTDSVVEIQAAETCVDFSVPSPKLAYVLHSFHSFIDLTLLLYAAWISKHLDNCAYALQAVPAYAKRRTKLTVVFRSFFGGQSFSSRRRN